MFIKTQNGKNLVNVDKVINFTNYFYSQATFNVNVVFTDDILTIGEYESEEDALKVIDDIMDAIEREEKIYIMPQVDEVKDIVNVVFAPRFILFRAKRISDNTWVYGDLVQSCQQIINAKGVKFPVDISTAGMYVGIVDINGRKIFEGDIVEVNNLANVFFSKEKMIVTFDNVQNHGFVLNDTHGLVPFNGNFRYLIVGNIYDNLLED